MNRCALVLLALVATPGLSHDESCKIEELDIRTLVASYVDRTDKQFVLDPRVRSKVSLPGLDIETMDLLTLVGIFNMHGFEAVEYNEITYVVPDRVAESFRNNVARNRSALRNTTTPAEFELQVSIDPKTEVLWLECQNGCAWERLPLACDMRNERCTLTVNGLGKFVN